MELRAPVLALILELLGGLGRMRRFLAEQLIDRDAENVCELRQQIDVRAGKVVFPFADCLRTHADALGKLLLRQAETFAVIADAFSKCGFIHFDPLLISGNTMP